MKKTLAIGLLFSLAIVGAFAYSLINPAPIKTVAPGPDYSQAETLV